MITQEEMYYRILALIFNAKFSLRSYSEESLLSCENPNQVGDWLIDWSSENNVSCPTLEELMDIPGFDLQAIKDSEAQAALVESLKSNLSFVAAYSLAKLQNPSLVFADYVGQIQDFSTNLMV